MLDIVSEPSYSLWSFCIVPSIFTGLKCRFLCVFTSCPWEPAVLAYWCRQCWLTKGLLGGPGRIPIKGYQRRRTNKITPLKTELDTASRFQCGADNSTWRSRLPVHYGSVDKIPQLSDVGLNLKCLWFTGVSLSLAIGVSEAETTKLWFCRKIGATEQRAAVSG